MCGFCLELPTWWIHHGLCGVDHAKANSRSGKNPVLLFDELQQVSRHWKDRVTPIAHDASESATINYITAHKAWTQPHAFVVDEQGAIVWHGQINRKELTQHVASVLSRAKTKAA